MSGDREKATFYAERMKALCDDVIALMLEAKVKDSMIVNFVIGPGADGNNIAKVSVVKQTKLYGED